MIQLQQVNTSDKLIEGLAFNKGLREYAEIPMIVSEFLQQTNDALRALDDDVPTLGTDEASYWLRTANRLVRNLYKGSKLSWASAYQIAELGTVSATATPTFELEEEFIAPAANAYVIATNGQRHEFALIKPQETDYLKQEVYVAGKNPQTLYFTKEILAGDQIIGGTLYLPGYYLPDEFTNANDEINVDDPDWLVVATAAKIASNDLTYEDKAPALNAEANSLFAQMTANNRRGVYGQPRRADYQVRRIPGTHRR